MEVFLFLVGGMIYTGIEILWRGWTHWTMFLLGGGGFVVLGLLNEYKIPWHWCLLRQAIVGATIITILEFITGCIVNLWLGWGVWDYSALPLNILGQVCLYYFLLWIPLCIVGIVLDDWIRYWRYLLVKKWCPWREIEARQRPRYRLVQGRDAK